MGALAVGDVVLIAFPYSDLTQRKVRPGLVVALAERSEAIVCQITSRPYSSRTAIKLDEWDFSEGSLERVSFARIDKLFTASPVLIHRRLGALEPAMTGSVRLAVANLFA